MAGQNPLAAASSFNGWGGRFKVIMRSVVTMERRGWWAGTKTAAALGRWPFWRSKSRNRPEAAPTALQ